MSISLLECFALSESYPRCVGDYERLDYSDGCRPRIANRVGESSWGATLHPEAHGQSYAKVQLKPAIGSTAGRCLSRSSGQ